MKTQRIYIKVLVAAILLFSLQSGVLAQTKAQTQDKQKIYTCPMHPDVQQTKPGKCPRCGMPLQLQKESEKAIPKDRTKMKKEITDTASIKHHRHMQKDTSHLKKKMKPDSLNKITYK